MGIGTSVFLLAAGAILAFAVHYTLGGVDLQVIGYIMMAAGVIGLVISTIILAPRSGGQSTSITRDQQSDAARGPYDQNPRGPRY